MKDISGQISIFDLIAHTPDEFCWDADINEIHNRLINLANNHSMQIEDDKWTIWSHVPHLGYRMEFGVCGTKQQFTQAFYEELQTIVDFAKDRKIELSPYNPVFFKDDEPEPMYIYSTFMDRERRKRK